ncbi:uncharacterized protein KGF55_000046 [Candida pseudojiufengensis]|uniref:uncharacterized protein n=1 Tax=Candida pseudojiufengensis TaxID=497109 RepID=UPI0022246476|nr:uncharacterized protein KGF55_000046 [Candida pseudojiufengensis]KAI5967814.1 hypothetical protein KGF55_000046 [Candida pseudojiufengensis]
MGIENDKLVNDHDDQKSKNINPNLGGFSSTNDPKKLLPPLGVKSDQQDQLQDLQQTHLQQQTQLPQAYDYNSQQPSMYSAYQQTSFDPYLQQRSLGQPQSSFNQIPQYTQQQYQNNAKFGGGSNIRYQYPSNLSGAPITNPTSSTSTQSSTSNNHNDLNLGHTSKENNKGRRFRRRYNQINRRFPCSYPNCMKSYGSLNHLNTHIVSKKHGHRKAKADFQNPSRPPKDDEHNYNQTSPQSQHQSTNLMNLQQQQQQQQQQQPPQQQQQQQQQSQPPQQQQYVTNDYSGAAYWYGYAPPNLRPTNTMVTNDSFGLNNQIPPQQTTTNMYYQGYQPMTSAGALSNNTQQPQHQNQNQNQPQAQQQGSNLQQQQQQIQPQYYQQTQQQSPQQHMQQNLYQQGQYQSSSHYPQQQQPQQQSPQ